MSSVLTPNDLKGSTNGKLYTNTDNWLAHQIPVQDTPKWIRKEFKSISWIDYLVCISSCENSICPTIKYYLLICILNLRGFDCFRNLATMGCSISGVLCVRKLRQVVFCYKFSLIPLKIHSKVYGQRWVVILNKRWNIYSDFLHSFSLNLAIY